MCVLWIITYTLALIGSVRYKKPLISPLTQACIAPFEFAVMFNLILRGGLNYVSVAYGYWTVIEVALFYVNCKLGAVSKNREKQYVLLVTLVMAAMLWGVVVKGWMLFFSYFNTFVGMCFWAQYIRREAYPMKPWAGAAFLIKFAADVLACLVYFHSGTWVISFMSVALPVLDFTFLITYWKRKRM